MSASNIWTQFKSLLPADGYALGTVLSHNSDGTTTVELLGGERIRPQGQSAAIGKKAIVQKGRVVGEAPALTQYDLIVP